MLPVIFLRLNWSSRGKWCDSDARMVSDGLAPLMAWLWTDWEGEHAA